MFWGQGALPPFQIEAGMGFVSAVCEMLVRSRPGFLRLLPALPDAWPQGNVRGSRHVAVLRLISPGRRRDGCSRLI
jgi:alpha-L-fucosidase 2